MEAKFQERRLPLRLETLICRFLIKAFRDVLSIPLSVNRKKTVKMKGERT
jgi:hypothetical protein